jgi:virginiamycin B lyase
MTRIRYILASAALLAAVITGGAFAHQARPTGVTARLPLKALADGIAFDGSSLWVKTTSDGKLVQVDPAAAKIQARYRVGTPNPDWPSTWGPDEWVAAGKNTVWVTDQPSNRVLGVDPRTRTVTTQLRVNTPWDVATGFGSLWVPLFDVNELDRVADDGTIAKRIAIPNPTAVAIGAGSVWVIAHRVGKVMRIDPATNRIIATIKLPDHGGWVGGGPERAAFGENALWTSTDGGVTRVDARTNTARHIEFPDQGFGTYNVTTGGGAAWVQMPNNVDRIDAKTFRVTNMLEIKHGDCGRGSRKPCVGALAFADGFLWVEDNGARQLLRVRP